MNFITKTAAIILEVSSSFYPEKNGIFSPDQNYILRSQQTWVSFGAGSNTVCGPSPYINTLNCFSTKFKNYSASVPIPGDLSTTPVFIDDHWIIGTAKGFLFKVKADLKNNGIPTITPSTTELWGSESRQIIESFAPKTIYKNPSETDEQARKNNKGNNAQTENYEWIFPTSSPFTGTPVIHNKIVYGITQNQTLQAIDYDNGKLIWSMKVGKQASLYLANHSINVKDSRLLVASNRGDLYLLNSQNGDVIAQTTVGTARDQENRFPSIVAAPLYTDDNHILVSNSISITQKLSLDSLETTWSYPEGSVNTPLKLNSSTVILLTTDGNAVSLDSASGATNWKTNLELLSPISTGILTNDNKTILIATQRGELIAVDSNSGKILTQNRAIGSVVGDFFPLAQHPDQSCLSFSTASFRCFKVKR